MNVKFKRIDKRLEPPKYHTGGSVGFDLVAREKVRILPGKLELLPLNIIIETPHGQGLFLTCRSSMPIKKGLLIPNGLGIIDQDYSGEEDELKLEAFNFTKRAVVVERGERIAQGIFVKIQIAKFKAVKNMKNKSRGGFGSTG